MLASLGPLLTSNVPAQWPRENSPTTHLLSRDNQGREEKKCIFVDEVRMEEVWRCKKYQGKAFPNLPHSNAKKIGLYSKCSSRSSAFFLPSFHSIFFIRI